MNYIRDSIIIPMLSFLGVIMEFLVTEESAPFFLVDIC